ncbi:MAG: FG-GAP repeat domain-containing protein [bacterium]
MMHLCLFTLLINFNLLSSAKSVKELYHTYDLQFEGELGSYHIEDLNNDGLKDILLILKKKAENPGQERWISVYLQKPNGFDGKPSQEFKVSDDIILYDIGDVQGDFQKEFVFFTSSGVYFYPFKQNQLDLTPQRLFAAQSIFMLSNKNRLQNWNFVADLNGDFVDEVIVPHFTRCDIYFRNPESRNWLINEVPLRAETKVSGFYDPRFSVGNKTEAQYAMPYIALQDFNADGRKDLIGIYQDSLVVYCQDNLGYFAKECHHKIDLFFGEIWKGAKIQRTRIGDKSERTFLKKILDLNHDGLLDVVSIRVSTKKSFVNPYNEVRIHLGKKDSTDSIDRVFFEKEPDQIIQPGGTQLVLDILDLNRDGRYDLIIPVVNVGLKNIISMLLTKSVEIQAEVYLMNKRGFYPEKPDMKNSLVVRFSYRGGATSPVYEIADFNGDGLLDILSSLDEKMLIFFWGSEKILDSKVSAKYLTHLPQNGEMVRAMHLNSDKKCDIVITYNEDNSRHKELESTLRILIAN